MHRTEAMVEGLRTRASLLANPKIGSAVNAKQTQLDRLLARRIKTPFIELREPVIAFQAGPVDGEQTVLSIRDYTVSFDESLLGNISFELRGGEKVAIVGANGTGKTSLMRDILQNDHPAIRIDENVRYACLSQLKSEYMDASDRI